MAHDMIGRQRIALPCLHDPKRRATVVYTMDSKVRDITSLNDGLLAIAEPIGKELRKEGLIRQVGPFRDASHGPRHDEYNQPFVAVGEILRVSEATIPEENLRKCNGRGHDELHEIARLESAREGTCDELTACLE